MAKRIILVMFIAMSYIFLSLQPVLAWGPERPTYTMEYPAKSATFNSITDNAAIGDERDFVRVAEVRTDGVKNYYANEIEVEAGKDYEVYIYYHNDASETYNTKEYDYRAVAANTRLSTDFPNSLKAGETGEIVGIISSTTTDPKEVWDEAKITAKEDLTLHYVTGSAKIHNGWDADGSILSTSMFSQKGTFIGLNELNGVILGCDKFSGHIIYKIRTMKPGEFEAEKAAEQTAQNDTETAKEGTTSKDLESGTLTNNAENSISPAILVCIGVAVGMVVMKVIGANRKK